MQEAKKVFGLDFFEGGICNDINNAAFGVELCDRVFADIDTLPEILVGNDLIHPRVDRNMDFELLLTALELGGLLFHLAADAAALQIRLALFGTLYGRDAQDIAVV